MKCFFSIPSRIIRTKSFGTALKTITLFQVKNGRLDVIYCCNHFLDLQKPCYASFAMFFEEEKNLV